MPEITPAQLEALGDLFVRLRIRTALRITFEQFLRDPVGYEEAARFKLRYFKSGNLPLLTLRTAVPIHLN